VERFSQGDAYKRHLLKKQEIHARLMPMGAITYAVACSICRNSGSDLCDDCRCEIASGFSIDKNKARILQDLPEEPKEVE
jgi:hypothetical protein